MSGRRPVRRATSSRTMPGGREDRARYAKGIGLAAAGLADLLDDLGIGEIGADDEIALAVPASALQRLKYDLDQVPDVDDGQPARERPHLRAAADHLVEPVVRGRRVMVSRAHDRGRIEDDRLETAVADGLLDDVLASALRGHVEDAGRPIVRRRLVGRRPVVAETHGADRGDVDQPLHAGREATLDDRPGARFVGRLELGFFALPVGDEAGQVDDVAVTADGFRDRAGVGDIAGERLHARIAPGLRDRISRQDERIHSRRSVLLDQAGHQNGPDKPGRPGDEDPHGCPFCRRRNRNVSVEIPVEACRTSG